MIFHHISPLAGLPRHRRDGSASNATVFFSKGSRFVLIFFLTSYKIITSNLTSSTLTDVTVGGILAACFAVLLLSFVPCYLKHRRRHSQSTPVNDVESVISRQTSFELRSLKTVSLPIFADSYLVSDDVIKAVHKASGLFASEKLKPCSFCLAALAKNCSHFHLSSIALLRVDR